MMLCSREQTRSNYSPIETKKSDIKEHQFKDYNLKTSAYLHIVRDEDLAEIEHLQHGGCIVVADAVAL